MAEIRLKTVNRKTTVPRSKVRAAVKAVYAQIATQAAPTTAPLPEVIVMVTNREPSKNFKK